MKVEEILVSFDGKVAPKSEFGERVYSKRRESYPRDPDLTKLLFSPISPYRNDDVTIIRIKDIGELSLIIDSQNKETAFFGFWDCLHDPNACHELFKTAKKRASEKGYSRLIGPIDFSTYFYYRLKLDFFDEYYSQEPLNPPYYPELLMHCGFECVQDYVSHFLSRENGLEEWTSKVKSMTEQQELLKSYYYRSLNVEWVRENKKELFELIKKIFSQNYAYRSIEFDLFEHQADRLVASLCPQTSIVMIHETGELAGLTMNLKDSFCSRRLIVKTLGVAPEHRHLGQTFWGLMAEVLTRSTQYDEAVLALMKVGNMPDLMTRGLASKSHHYGLYQLSW